MGAGRPDGVAHYGWWPSFVNELAKWAYWTPSALPTEMAPKLADRDFGPEGGPLAVQAWEAWSEAILDYVPANEDQYGPFRVGPAYPLVLEQDVEFPSAPYAHFGARILNTLYSSRNPDRIEGEIGLLERMKSRWEEGVALLEQAVEAAPERKLPEAERMLGLGRFIRNCVQTTVNTKHWWLLKQRLADESEDANAVLDEMVALAEAEIANAEATIPLAEADSRLGWEPSMEYMCDPSHLEWKIAQVRTVIDEEIPAIRESL